MVVISVVGRLVVGVVALRVGGAGIGRRVGLWSSPRPVWIIGTGDLGGCGGGHRQPGGRSVLAIVGIGSSGGGRRSGARPGRLAARPVLERRAHGEGAGEAVRL